MQSRRALLARVAAGAGVVGTGGLAGCVADPLDGGGSGDDLPSYADRLYDPAESLVGVGLPNGAFVSYDLATLYGLREQVSDRVSGAVERADRSTEAVSVPDLKQLTAVGYWRDGPTDDGSGDPEGVTSVVVDGSFRPEVALEEIRSEVGESATVEGAGRVRGQDLYVLDSERPQTASLAFGVGEERLSFGGAARVDATGEDALRAIVTSDDAEYYAENDTARRLVDAMGAATVVVGVETPVEQYAPDSVEGTPAAEEVRAVLSGLTGVGTTMTVGEETISRAVVGVYAEGETPEQADVEAVLDAARQSVATQVDENVDAAAVQELIDDTTVAVEGQSVTASVEREIDAVFDDETATPGGVLGGPVASVLLAPVLAVVGTFVLGSEERRDEGQTTPGATPTVAFDFEYDEGTGEVTVTHAGGDVLKEDNTERVMVRSGSRPPVPWELPVSAGDAVTVPAAGGDTVRVLWTAPGGGETVTLGSFTVP